MGCCQLQIIGAYAADSLEVDSDAIINDIKRQHRVILAKPNTSTDKGFGKIE